ncbi:MAG: ribosomal RNA small subunit methyltransferase A [Deltaproteobacteria bacterium]|nr:ribosomal RNA small subunit methyltransferase A [Deltaproteobacteria bacterium]
MNSVRKILARYDIRPLKRLGQSFLEDMNMVCRISALVEPKADETVVEIGAGLGLLTAELAKKAGRVIALEIDPRLVAVLRDRFAGDERVEIIQGDVLVYDFSAACRGGRIKVVGNIPYHISTPILFRLLEFRSAITSMVLMFQKELADRIIARPGKKEYGILSVLFARYASAVREMTIPPSCFYPVPGVVSAVLRIILSNDAGTPEGEALFVKTVRASFARRRKTLRNNLRAAGFAEDALERVFVTAGIEGARRAETLTLGEFQHLASALLWCPDAS